jgi:hypothetical protein
MGRDRYSRENEVSQEKTRCRGVIGIARGMDQIVKSRRILMKYLGKIDPGDETEFFQERQDVMAAEGALLKGYKKLERWLC